MVVTQTATPVVESTASATPRESPREYFTIDQRIMPVVGWNSAGYISFHNPQAQGINGFIISYIISTSGTNFISNVKLIHWRLPGADRMLIVNNPVISTSG